MVKSGSIAKFMKIPKSSQLYFFLMPFETKMIIEYLIQYDCVILSDRSQNSIPSECKSFDNISQSFCCPRRFFNDVKMNKISNSAYFIDSFISPVVEIDASVLREKQLSRGRLYFRGGYLGRDKWISYPNELYDLYKGLKSFMKKTILTKDREYLGYISKGSRNFVQEGGNLTQF